MQKMFEELFEKLQTQNGIPTQEGSRILDTIVEHVKEKFPQVAGPVDGVIGRNNFTATSQAIVPDESQASLQELEKLAKN